MYIYINLLHTQGGSNLLDVTFLNCTGIETPGLVVWGKA